MMVRVGMKSMSWTKMGKANLGENGLKQFGVTMAAALLVISVLFFLRSKVNLALFSFTVSFFFLIVGLVFPSFLRVFHTAWMFFAFVLSWVNTRVILVVLYFFIFTPIGLVIKLFRVDPLGENDKRETYWLKREGVSFNPLNYERRF
jgi:hypothetical protein